MWRFSVVKPILLTKQNNDKNVVLHFEGVSTLFVGVLFSVDSVLCVRVLLVVKTNFVN